MQVGTHLPSLVPDEDIWVQANFKETQVGRMRDGQKARLTFDAFPDTPIDGRIDSLFAASGAQFSLLPPDNATGNFTKVVQRIPVKIVFEADNPLHDRIRPGMSVEAEVELRDPAEALARPLGEPTRRDWIAVLSAMLGAFMAVLDIQITNSSLKDIQGALAATLEEGSWISTSYLVAEIIMIPMTAWLVQLLSARRLAVMISVGFLVSSLLCSFAWNLESMIVFRAMQGFTGGALDSAGVHPGPGQVAGTPPSGRAWRCSPSPPPSRPPSDRPWEAG